MNSQNIQLHLNNNMISDALTAVAHDSRTQVIAFAGLWNLFTAGSVQPVFAARFAAAELDVEHTPEFFNSCMQIWKELLDHQAAPGETLGAGANMELSPSLVPFIDIMRAALLDSLPETRTATTQPSLTRPVYSGGMQLVSRSKAKPTFKNAPRFFKAIDALNAVPYTLNPDIMGLGFETSPLGTEYSDNLAARQTDILSASWLADIFYFRHTVDSRGRIYARSVLITPQGDSFSKASINFAVKKPLGEFGLGALAIHYANCSGHDKISFADRITWAKTIGMRKARAFVNCHSQWARISDLIEDDKHAFEEYAAGMEFYRACNTGNPQSFESSLIVHQDATTSGFQFGAALLGDRETAALTNITGDCTKTDAPGDLYNEMAKHLRHLITEANECTQYLEVIDRKFCKKPIMTTGYGAGKKTIMRHIKQYLEDMNRADLATVHALAELQPFVEEALELTASSMLSLSMLLREQAEVILAGGGETIQWTTPDGFEVIQQYRDASDRKVKLGKKSGIRNRVAGEMDPIDESKMSTALPPNFIHSMDGQMVRTAVLSAKDAGVEVAAIHDSFGTHAGTFKQLNQELRHAFVETLEYDWFHAFNVGNSTNLRVEKGDYNALEALMGVYMFS